MFFCRLFFKNLLNQFTIVLLQGIYLGNHFFIFLIFIQSVDILVQFDFKLPFYCLFILKRPNCIDCD